jgi:Arc/MetJ-type ribon-helix-helix transcriptional regulator
MIPVQVRVTKKLMELLDKLIESGAYSNRSEAIRDSIRKNISNFHSSGFLEKVIEGVESMEKIDKEE